MWAAEWGSLPLVDDTAQEVLDHLVSRGLLNRDQGMLFIGPEAEKSFGRRHFIELTSAFTAAPELAVLHGRTEIGMVHPLAVTVPTGEAAPTLLLGGRNWAVEHIDWRRRRCYVVPAPGGGRAQWYGGASPLSFALVRAQRAVVLGAEPRADWSQRAVAALARQRAELGHLAWAGETVLRQESGDLTWWIWAGGRTNATLAAAFPQVADPAARPDNRYLRLREGTDAALLARAVDAATGNALPAPAVTREALDGLKFSAALPPHLAARTLSERLADPAGARRVLSEPRQTATG